MPMLVPCPTVAPPHIACLNFSPPHSHTSTNPSCCQDGDVITHFNGVEIADDGTFLFREAVRIDFRHLVSQAFRGDMADVSGAVGYDCE